MLIGNPQPFRNPSLVRVFEGNVCLWGRLGEANGRPTQVSAKSQERAPHLIDFLSRNADNYDYIALTECFDPTHAREFMGALRNPFPYSCYFDESLAPKGVQGVIEHVQKKSRRLGQLLANHAECVISCITGFRYWTEEVPWGGALGLFRHDLVGWLLDDLLKLPLFCGSGLLFLSRDPIESAELIPHPTAGFERLTRKGSAVITVQNPVTKLRFVLSHGQEGELAHETAVRDEQIELWGELTDCREPVQLVGDLNEIAEVKGVATDRYRKMMARLKLRDAYREVHRDPVRKPGKTYNGARIGSTQGRSRPARVDYDLVGPDFEPVESEVIPIVMPDGRPAADHDGLSSTQRLAA